jgi:hypothetical protein
MEAFEYAIKKDVRNNTIVREVDEARQRQLWKSASLADSCDYCWFGMAALRAAAPRLPNEELNRERAVEEETGHQLRLEIDTSDRPSIESLATGGSIVAPSAEEAVVPAREPGDRRPKPSSPGDK